MTRLRPVLAPALLGLIAALACSDDGGSDRGTTTLETSGDGDGEPGESEDSGETTGDGDPGDGDGDPGDGDPGDGDPGDGDGDPSGCQPTPEICAPNQVCDVISGECVDPDTPCTLSGDANACGSVECGPGSVCDDQGSCIGVAPCAGVECEGDQCWGTTCVCDRPVSCSPADLQELNGPFATDIFDLEFADDCDAFMVTLRSGTDYVRRMTPDGILSEWAGVANLNMGEVKVLKALNPQLPAPTIDDVLRQGAEPSSPVDEMLGDVAITYTCCPTCGCFVDPPQGVARLLEGEMVPLPIVLAAVPTQGNNGPFNQTAADAGPMGLTWGEDLKLYVGNAEQNGNFDTADLQAETNTLLTTFGSRVTAAAPVSSVHLLVALDTGELLRFNTQLAMAVPVVDLGVGVTTLSHDSFSGLVYASLSDLSIVSVDPFAGTTADFDAMPNLGRVTVSPDGALYWVPAKFAIGDMPITTWDLPDSF